MQHRKAVATQRETLITKCQSSFAASSKGSSVSLAWFVCVAKTLGSYRTVVNGARTRTDGTFVLVCTYLMTVATDLQPLHNNCCNPTGGAQIPCITHAAKTSTSAFGK